MSIHYDLCINGAGPIGSTLACLLAQKGMKILLLERHPLVEKPNPALDGRAYALAEGIRPLLEEAGIWQLLPRTAQPIRHIHVVDSPNGPSSRPYPVNRVDFTADDSPEGRAFGWMVEAYDLLAACARSLHTHPNLTIAAPDQGQFSFCEDTVTITHSTGTATAQLAIAADGRRSMLREQAGIPLSIIPYHKYAFVTVLTHEHSHHSTALEHFLPQGPFACLPLPSTTEHPHRSAIVITDKETRIRHLMEMDNQPLTHYIAERLSNEALGKLTVTGKRWLYPLSSQYAHRYTAQRLLLIGDAAHGLHPVAGQGMNAGFRDVRRLVPLLAAAFQNNHDPGAPELLACYQQQTRPRNFTMLAGCDMMERLFSNRHPFLSRVRRLGLIALERSPQLRHLFIQQAMGL